MTERKDYTLNAEPGKYEVTGEPVAFRLYWHLPENHQIYNTVGRIASEWSHLEHMLDLIIWDLMQHEDAKVACITSQLMGAESRLRAIMNLLSLRGDWPGKPDLTKRLNKLKADANTVGEGRHRAVHDPWYMEAGTDQAAQFKSMPFKKPAFGLTDIDAAEQAKVIADIRELNERAGRLRNDVQSLIASSGGTPPRSPLIGQAST